MEAARRWLSPSWWLGWCVLMSSLLGRTPVGAQPDQTVATQDPYAQLLTQAERLDARGELAAAAALLERAAPHYPDDFLLHLRLAYAQFRLARYHQALEAYRRAFALSAGQRDAALGLGFTLAKLGRCDEAVRQFEAVLERSANDAGAQQGLTLCATPHAKSLRAEARVIGHAYVGHPVLSHALGAQAALSGQPAPWLSLGALYRATQFWSARGVLGGGRSRRALRFQHELYLHGGVQSPRLGVAATYAYVTSGADDLARAHVAGLMAWGAPLTWLSLWLEASGSFYDDIAVARAQPGVSCTIGPHLGLRPSVGLQLLRGGLLAAAELELSVRYRPLTLLVGGRWGKQQRPSFLSQPTVYNIDDVIGAGIWSVAELALSQTLTLNLTYELQRRTATDPQDDRPHEALAHYAVLGLRFEP